MTRRTVMTAPSNLTAVAPAVGVVTVPSPPAVAVTMTMAMAALDLDDGRGAAVGADIDGSHRQSAGGRDDRGGERNRQNAERFTHGASFMFGGWQGGRRC